MKMHIGKFNLGLLMAALILVGCDSTKFVSTYQAPEVNETYSNVYVVGLAGTAIPDKKMAEHMVNKLEERGVTASTSDDLFDPHTEMMDEERAKISEELKDQGVEAILIFTLVNKVEEKDIVSPASYDTPPGPIEYPYYNDYYQYYKYRAPDIYSEGFHPSETVYNMEASLFDLETDKLIWSGKSKTVEPASREEFAENYARSVAYKLVYEDIVGNKD